MSLFGAHRAAGGEHGGGGGGGEQGDEFRAHRVLLLWAHSTRPRSSEAPGQTSAKAMTLQAALPACVGVICMPRDPSAVCDPRPMLSRRDLVLALLAAGGSSATGAAGTADPAPALTFPRDFGAHPESRIEWWYVTGRLRGRGARRCGFQITFFRTATGIVGADASAFRRRRAWCSPMPPSPTCRPAPAARPAARAQRLRHRRGRERGHRPRAARLVAGAQPGDPQAAAIARAASETAGFALRPRAARPPSRCCCRARKGCRARARTRRRPATTTASRSSRVEGRSRSTAARRRRRAAGPGSTMSGATRCCAADAVGWDWIGMNLDDGSALTAFRLRAPGRQRALGRRQSFRPRRRRGARLRARARSCSRPARRWTSPASQATYPVEWIVTHAGRLLHGAGTARRPGARQPRLAPARSTGKACRDLLDGDGRHVGSGYLEMTGYAGRLRI